MTKPGDKHYVSAMLLRTIESYGLVAIYIREGSFNYAVGRIYHASFYSICTLLSIPPFDQEVHDKTINRFDLEYIKTGKISALYGSTYSELYALCHKDISGSSIEKNRFTREEIVRLDKRATKLFDAVWSEIFKLNTP